MAIAIDLKQIEDINNPSFEVLNWCINQHQAQLPRLEMLFDYYNGFPHELGKPASPLTPQQKQEIYVNNAKYITDMFVGFTVGSPIAYSAQDDAKITDVLDALERMRINKHDKELAKDISVYGTGLELHYLAPDPSQPNKTIPKIACIDPRGMFVAVDDTVERTKLFAVRYMQKQRLNGQSVWEFNIYTKDSVITYVSKLLTLTSSSLIEEPTTVPHFYNDVPVTEYRNNEEKQGDFEQQISQIDGYNKLQTDRIKDKENFIKAVMVLYGFTLPEEKPDEINGNMVIEAPAQEDGAAAEFLVNTFNETEVQVLADSILDDLHKTAYIPNLNDEKFSGNVSGEAMKYKLFGLLLVLATKVGYMEDGIIERLRLLSNILGIKNKRVDVDGIKISFKPNLPINRGDVIQQIRDSQEFVPLLISLGWLDDVDDPQEVIDTLKAQKEADIQLNLKALGQAASHSDIEPDNSEGENDNNSDSNRQNE